MQRHSLSDSDRKINWGYLAPDSHIDKIQEELEALGEKATIVAEARVKNSKDRNSIDWLEIIKMNLTEEGREAIRKMEKDENRIEPVDWLEKRNEMISFHR